MEAQKNFINYHVLISHSPSCLNRDDQNMQKRAVFGGVERIRISSQCLKRAMRKSQYYQQNLGSPSIRSNKLDKLVERLAKVLDGRYSRDLVTKAVEWMSGKDEITVAVEADSVAPWAAEEVAMFCEKIKQGEEDKIDPDKLKKMIEKDASPFKKNLASAIDIALSGRMATFGLMNALPVDGSLAVAHAITTHAAQADTDWFAAVDDLIQDSGEVGAGHLDTQEFSSGVFYRYASLNIEQLKKNLGGDTRERALEIAKHVFHMLCTVVPTAKQQSFAAHNPADFAIVTFDDQPISLANAFERPVEAEKNSGLLLPSIKALVKYFEHMKKVYGLGSTAVAVPKGLFDSSSFGLAAFETFSEVENWIVKDPVATLDKE